MISQLNYVRILGSWFLYFDLVAKESSIIATWVTFSTLLTDTAPLIDTSLIVFLETLKDFYSPKSQN